MFLTVQIRTWQPDLQIRARSERRFFLSLVGSTMHRSKEKKDHAEFLLNKKADAYSKNVNKKL